MHRIILVNMLGMDVFNYIVLLECLPDVAARIQEQPEITLNCAALGLHTVS